MSLWQAGQATAHARHTEAHVGGQNIDFSLVFKENALEARGSTAQTSSMEALEPASTPFRQAVWGISGFSKKRSRRNIREFTPKPDRNRNFNVFKCAVFQMFSDGPAQCDTHPLNVIRRTPPDPGIQKKSKKKTKFE